MRVLVTGGAGFIGSNMVNKLVNLDHDVFVMDSFHTGSRKNLSSELDEIKLFQGKVCEINEFSLSKIDFIFHLGIYSSTLMYRKNPMLVPEVIGDAIALLEVAKKNHSGIILASSSSVYNGLPLPWKENMQPKVTDLYTEARIGVERLTKLYHDWYGIKAVILRFFSVFGPREEFKGRFANTISQFLWRIMKNKAPIIYGDGTQTRDFIYVEDVVTAAVLAMESDLEFEIINIGSGKNKSSNEIVEVINRKLGKDIRPIYVSNPIKNYVYHTLADTTKARKTLKFEARVDLEEGIERTIDYYRKIPELPDV